MILADIPLTQVVNKITRKGVVVRIGRFYTLIKMPNVGQLIHDFYHLYRDCPIGDENTYVDFSVSLLLTPGLRSYFKRQINFDFCGRRPFEPLPIDQALPLLEWGMNWCVSQHYHDCLIIHAAVVEKNGQAIILPGLPGAGKSTLCAGLVNLGGWRLLSDELTLIDRKTGEIRPNPRPISLKNQSINIVAKQRSGVFHSTVVDDTVKGSVALFQPPQLSISSAMTAVPAKYIIFPQYRKDSSLEFTLLGKGRAFLELANQSFNYSILAQDGFDIIAKQMDQVECFEFRYDGDLQQAVKAMDKLVS